MHGEDEDVLSIHVACGGRVRVIDGGDWAACDKCGDSTFPVSARAAGMRAESHRESDGVWQGPLYRDCGTCNFVRRIYGRAWCVWCAKEILHGCSTLAANLAVAGALCEAFYWGTRRGYLECPCDEVHDAESWRLIDAESWRPGCQRPAPGHPLATAPGVGVL